MRKIQVTALAALSALAVGVGGAAVVTSPATAEGAADSASSRYPHTITINAVEKATAVNLVDVAPSDSALGDQLIGTADLLGADGRKIGVSSFLGISTDVKPRTAELLTFVYELPDGKITTSGTARLAATGPVFDEQFAITGGTGRY